MSEHNERLLAGRLTRRKALGLGAGLGVLAAGGLSLSAAMSRRPAFTGAELTSGVPLPPPYTVPLPIPEVLEPANSTTARELTGNENPAEHRAGDRYEITQREVTAEILPGIPTTLWTYNGTFPGPTIESRRGRPVRVTHRNELPVPTVVHLHGGRTPAASDGYPTDLVLPEGWHGQTSSDGHGGHAGHGGDSGARGHHDPRATVTRKTRDYLFPLDQRAAMLWYHDHRMDFTGPAIWRGLAGMHIVRDQTEDSLDLPAGDHELPLMIVDRAFSADGQLAYPSLDPQLRGPHGVTASYLAGVLGDIILVNGAPWPVHEVDNGRYRLRLLNASNARHYDLRAVTDDGRQLPLVQIGADQGLLSAPVTHPGLPIAPAERYDVILDFGDVPVGGRVRLTNRLGTGRTGEIMQFHVVRTARISSAVPAQLAADLPTWPRSQAAIARDVTFRVGRLGEGHGWLIDGRPFDPTRSDITTHLGQTEIWRLMADVHHPVHLHLVGFRVLSRGGRPPLPHDGGLKDTISLRPGESAEIITRFEGYRGRYLFHCHNIEHEDMGMMANLEIL